MAKSKWLAIDVIMHNLKKTYLPQSEVYKTVEKAMEKLTINEIYSLNAMVLSIKAGVQ